MLAQRRDSAVPTSRPDEKQTRHHLRLISLLRTKQTLTRPTRIIQSRWTL